MLLADQAIEHLCTQAIQNECCGTALLVLGTTGIESPGSPKGARPFRLASHRILNQIEVAILADDQESSLYGNGFEHILHQAPARIQNHGLMLPCKSIQD